MNSTPDPADHQDTAHADEQPPREIKYRRNPQATQPGAVLTVRADEQLGNLYQQIAPVDHQQIAHADEQPPRITKSTPNAKATEPDDVLIARADERLKHAYEQIARANEQLAHVTERLSRIEHRDVRHSLAIPGHRASPGRPALRGFIGLLLAACIFSAGFVWQSPYGDPAKVMIARWMPQLFLTSPQQRNKLSLPVQPSSSADQGQEPRSTQSTAQTAAQEVTPTPALTPELVQMLPTSARDLPDVEQRIEQLKLIQEQMARDSAKAIEQLKTSQEQMARENAKVVAQLKEQMASFIAKASEQNARPKTSTAPPRPVVTPRP